LTIKKGCEEAINNGILTPELVIEGKAYSTTDIGDFVVSYILNS